MDSVAPAEALAGGTGAHSQVLGWLPGMALALPLCNHSMPHFPRLESEGGDVSSFCLTGYIPCKALSWLLACMTQSCYYANIFTGTISKPGQKTRERNGFLRGRRFSDGDMCLGLEGGLEITRCRGGKGRGHSGNKGTKAGKAVAQGGGRGAGGKLIWKRGCSLDCPRKDEVTQGGKCKKSLESDWSYLTSIQKCQLPQENYFLKQPL